MIHKLLLFNFLFVGLICQAQFSLSKTDGTPLTDGEIVGFSATYEELKFHVTNTGTSDINVKIKCTGLTNTDGSNFFFCIGGYCFNDIILGTTYPLVSQSALGVTIGPGDNQGDFDSFRNHNAGDGTSYPMDFEVKFFEVDNSGVEIGTPITITYRYDPALSIEDLNQVLKQVLNSNQKTILLVIYNSQNQKRYIGVKLD